MREPSVSIVILNMNGWRDTVECLGSLFSVNYSNYIAIVVDNGSTDGSVEKMVDSLRNTGGEKRNPITGGDSERAIRVFEYSSQEAETGLGYEKEIKSLPSNSRVVIIRNEDNLGFAEGNNVGIRYAHRFFDPDYTMLLNNDTTVDREFLANAVKLIDGDPIIGAVQSKLLNFDDPTRIDSLGQRLFAYTSPSDIGRRIPDPQNRDPVEIFGACAAAALYRSKVLEKIGLLDRRLFIILEDVDLSWRIRLNGNSCFLANNSVVYHKGGVSRGRRPAEKGRNSVTGYRHFANALLLAFKYYPVTPLIKFSPTYLYLALASTIRSTRLGKTGELARMVVAFLFIERSTVQSNVRIREIQKKWILNISYSDYFKKMLRKASELNDSGSAAPVSVSSLKGE